MTDKRRGRSSAALHEQQIEAELMTLRSSGESDRDDVNRIIAGSLERDVVEALAFTGEPGVGTGGELVPIGQDAIDLPGLVDTVRNPDHTTLVASRERIQLADDAHCYDLAFDAAETIQARNSIEKMLAHQMAATHRHAMKMLAEAERWRSPVEKVRLTNGAARLMAAFNDAATTLSKLRSGGQQRVTVVHQHVQVAGGQVAVAGHVEKGSSDGER
jgi:hypothetical protein